MATMQTDTAPQAQIPCADVSPDKMPGHWLLASLGKRVLRPGGLELTRKMLDALGIDNSDEVVEFAPGLGLTTQLALRSNPSAYTAIERDQTAAKNVRRILTSPNQDCRIGDAAKTGLPKKSATVVFGEAMLTMHTTNHRRAIVREAARILKPGGRYGIHELCMVPNDIDEKTGEQIRRGITRAIHHSAHPLTSPGWKELLEAEGFDIQAEFIAPMHLLEPRRMISDEGLGGAMRILFNILRKPSARHRVMAMRRTFSQHRNSIAAISLVAVRKSCGCANCGDCHGA